MRDEVDYLHENKPQRFLQVDTIILVVCGQACPKVQNYKLAISLQYLKKEVSNEAEFLRADKYESLLEIRKIILMGMVKHSQSSHNSKFAMSLQYLKKEVRDEVDFLRVDKRQSFLQVDSNALGIKVSFKVVLSY